jgi:nitrate reductase delta subunit
MVLEGEGRLPGYPPRETTVLFWTDPGTRHRLRLFKAAEAVTEEDLPVRWLLPTLVDDGDGECC